ncbi:GntR family transcriptional regulator [Pseudonocardia sp. DSM 110487]|jgi:DNA-binding GntR family transcriptional regulator|uniref:GntR family transcriptional regulator n=1 Tax=Pseudonocardia sp. DSM 110487 TaxID=2865833 RepID=UPI001C6954AB|nr:GntR family transcriptional regulator [Pseudonocardia sp. DSM 110487]QYN33572.1 GntR family transcriptional regulator [Pseudonocardia sp. DSM 110487]
MATATLRVNPRLPLTGHSVSTRQDPVSEQQEARLSLTDRAYSRLKEEILTARRRPESLLLEHELAEEYGVSKTPVREALRLLVHDGWVLVIPRKGYLVRPFRFDDVREIFAMRQMIEPALVAEAAKRSTPDQLDVLDRHIDAQVAAIGNAEAAMGAAAAFHMGIAKLAGNRRAEKTLQTLVDEARRMHYLVPSLDRRVTSNQEFRDHRDLVAAMRRMDLTLAQEIMERHSQESIRQTLEGLTQL